MIESKGIRGLLKSIQNSPAAMAGVNYSGAGSGA